LLFTINNSNYENEGNRYTQSLEKVHGIVDSECLARTKSSEDIHTKTVEHSTSHMVIEENFHTLTHNKDFSLEKS